MPVHDPHGGKMSVYEKHDLLDPECDVANAYFEELFSQYPVTDGIKRISDRGHQPHLVFEQMLKDELMKRNPKNSTKTDLATEIKSFEFVHRMTCERCRVYGREHFEASGWV